MPQVPGGTGEADPSALIAAIEAGDEGAARALLADDSALGMASVDGATVLRRAAAAGLEDLVADVLATGPRLELEDAAAVGDVEAVQAALDDDRDAGSKVGADGFTPLHVAAWFGQVKVAELLLNRGADVDAVSHNAHAVQPINVAASRDHAVLVHLLLDHGADVDAAMAGGFRPLHAASDHGHLEILGVLLDRGADPNARNDAGLTPADVAHDDAVRAVFAAL